MPIVKSMLLSYDDELKITAHITGCSNKFNLYIIMVLDMHPLMV